jgi:type II secretory pathway component PulJ
MTALRISALLRVSAVMLLSSIFTAERGGTQRYAELKQDITPYDNELHAST